MKRSVYLLISLLLAMCNSLYSSYSDSGNDLTGSDSLKVMATPDLYNLTLSWAAEYNRQYPGANISVINVADQERAADLLKKGNIGFVSGEFYAGFKDQALWNAVVGRDVIVPVINAKNPFMEEITLHGISPAVLSNFAKNVDFRNWDDLLMNGNDRKVEYYCLNDNSALSVLADFLKTDETLIAGRNRGNTAEVVSAIQKDPYAIGFCRLISIIDPENQGMVENIRLLPIDRNGNGLIDSNEKIYDDPGDFTRGVWIGKYPRSLFSNIYTVAGVQPEKGSEIDFIRWVLTDGQKYLSVSGYSDLLVGERQSAADRLYNARLYAGASSGEKNLLKSLMFVIGTIILIGLIASSIARQRKRKKAAVKITGSPVHPVLDQDSLKIPKGIYFDKTHTWAFLEANGVVKVGIDDFLQHITGKITRIKMKSTGKKVKKGDQILSLVQNGKQLNLYAPVSGTIIEQNEALEGNSSCLNSSPYNDGWVYRIEPSNWSRESQLLFMADKQRDFIRKEFTRLKDFLMTAPGSETGLYAQVILQDGGEISDGVLSQMGPEIWEDFQTNFIDPSRQVWFYEIM
jgi:glycine cleavage system H lipoate-binding protein/ABC-type phosphate transport system substrate-binding protein